MFPGSGRMCGPPCRRVVSFQVRDSPKSQVAFDSAAPAASSISTRPGGTAPKGAQFGVLLRLKRIGPSVIPGAAAPFDLDPTPPYAARLDVAATFERKAGIVQGRIQGCKLVLQLAPAPGRAEPRTRTPPQMSLPMGAQVDGVVERKPGAELAAEHGAPEHASGNLVGSAVDGDAVFLVRCREARAEAIGVRVCEPDQVLAGEGSARPGRQTQSRARSGRVRATWHALLSVSTLPPLSDGKHLP